MNRLILAAGVAAAVFLAAGVGSQSANAAQPCVKADQASRGSNNGAPPDSQQASRGNDSGAPPDSQQASRGNASGAPPDAQQASRGNDSGAPPDSQLAGACE